jgi:thiamine-monophosphate kinase
MTMAGEDEILEWIAGRQKTSKVVKVAAGDDLAVLEWPEGERLVLVGADQVLDGVHFRCSEISDWSVIGRKAMNRNLSDCAAMACMPVAAVVTVALPKGATVEQVKALYEGLEAAGAKYYCPVVGGDTGVWAGPLAVTVAIMGRATGSKPVLRSGALSGDGIYVTGPLGGSILGRHLTFEPRVHEGRLLAASRLPTAMMDVSDGLLKDLGRMLKASGGLGAVIEADKVPVHADAVRLAGQDGVDALRHALSDGEDHELLFTSTARPPVGIRIGKVTAGGGVILKYEDGREEPAAASGWEHRLG